MTALVPLLTADERCGGKASTLGLLMRSGIAVPPGFVVRDSTDDSWSANLAEELAKLGPGPFAVRSSSFEEDGTHASFAGQLHTTLNVESTTGVIRAVAATAASGGSVAARAYASRLGRETADAVPTLVQLMLTPTASGVMFTQHPVTGADHCVIEAVLGLGDDLVAGTITPERWIVDGDPTIADQGPTGTVLQRHDVRELVSLGRRIEVLLGAPLDIEWAIADGQIWVLQARPITSKGRCAPLSRKLSPGTPPLVSGTGASPGRRVGPVSVVNDLDGFADFSAGDVLVCQTTSPAWTPLLARAAAVVTETGGMLAHAAIVAREFGIPAVVAASGATSLLVARSLVLVDGDLGIVTALRVGGSDQ